MTTATSGDLSPLAIKCMEFCQALASQGKTFSFNPTTGLGFSFSLDTRGSGKPTSDMAEQVKKRKKLSPSDIRRNQRRHQEFLRRKSGRKEGWRCCCSAKSWKGMPALSWKGAYSSLYWRASTYTCAWREKWRRRFVILFAITSSYLASGLWSCQVWQHVEWSLWKDFQQWRWIENSCSSWWSFHLHSQEIFNTLSMGRMHISWIKTIVSCRRELSIRY